MSIIVCLSSGEKVSSNCCCSSFNSWLSNFIFVLIKSICSENGVDLEELDLEEETPKSGSESNSNNFLFRSLNSPIFNIVSFINFCSLNDCLSLSYNSFDHSVALSPIIILLVESSNFIFSNASSPKTFLNPSFDASCCADFKSSIASISMP